MIDSKEIGRRLIIMRGKMSRRYVAEAVGVTESAYAMYERGERIPRDSIKVNIAEFFDKDVQEIFFDEECHI